MDEEVTYMRYVHVVKIDFNQDSSHRHKDQRLHTKVYKKRGVYLLRMVLTPFFGMECARMYLFSCSINPFVPQFVAIFTPGPYNFCISYYCMFFFACLLQNYRNWIIVSHFIVFPVFEKIRPYTNRLSPSRQHFKHRAQNYRIILFLKDCAFNKTPL